MNTSLGTLVKKKRVGGPGMYHSNRDRTGPRQRGKSTLWISLGGAGPAWFSVRDDRSRARTTSSFTLSKELASPLPA